MAWYVLDLADYSVRAGFLLFLCKNRIGLKEKYRSVGKILFFMQSLMIGFWTANSGFLNRVLYGGGDTINNSAYSIVKVAVVFLCSFAAMDILYQGGRLAKCYLLSVFYAVQEMARFMLHSVWTLGTMLYLSRINERLMANELDADRYRELAGYIQTYGMLFFSAGMWLMMCAVLRLYRRCQTRIVTGLHRQGIYFLMLLPVVSLAFDALWRVTLYYRSDTTIEFLYDRHGSMYVMIPAIAALCMAGIVLSAKVYGELVDSQEQKNSLLFYRQQLVDMTEHVRELEQLYDGIRGMRHDINNCVADMEQLLQACEEGGQFSGQIRQEARQYLRNMQRATDELTLQFATGNPVTDVILNRKGQICAQEKIDLNGDFVYPANLSIEAFDLGIALNNALDNAIEACRRLPESAGRKIRFRGYGKGRMFFLVVENTYDRTAARVKDGRPVTTKQDERMHGFGMSNMRKCVEKYYGTMEYEAGAEWFVLTLMMQGRDGS